MADGSADERPRNRSVLGDVTNQLGKRRFFSIPGNSGSDYLKNVENKSGNTKHARKISSGVENVSKGKNDSEFVAADEGKIDSSSTKAKESCADNQLSQGKAVSSLSGFPSEIKEFSGLVDGNRIFVLGKKAVTTRNVEEMGGDDLTLNKSCFTGCSVPSGSSVPKVPESQIFKGLSNDDCSNASADMAFLKTCSCSFCLKAAYIWSDLHYQDAKCRLAVIKKTRKEVRSVIESSFNYSVSDNNGPGNSINFTNLEFDLLGQWRLLFLHTDNIFTREGSQLQSSLLNLKELRENCKADLEIVDSAPSNN